MRERVSEHTPQEASVCVFVHLLGETFFRRVYHISVLLWFEIANVTPFVRH